jgi:hypothetical protein
MRLAVLALGLVPNALLSLCARVIEACLELILELMS